MSTGIEVMKMALHIQNWKKTPSPILIPFKGKKFDPKQITAMNTPMKPKAISFIFKMEEIKLYQCRALESSDRRLVAKFSAVGL